MSEVPLLLSAQDSNQVSWSVLSPHEVVSFLVGGVDAGDVQVGLQTKTGNRCFITGRTVWNILRYWYFY